MRPLVIAVVLVIIFSTHAQDIGEDPNILSAPKNAPAVLTSPITTPTFTAPAPQPEVVEATDSAQARVPAEAQTPQTNSEQQAPATAATPPPPQSNELPQPQDKPVQDQVAAPATNAPIADPPQTDGTQDSTQSYNNVETGTDTSQPASNTLLTVTAADDDEPSVKPPMKPTFGFNFDFTESQQKLITREERADAEKTFCKMAKMKTCTLPQTFLLRAGYSPEVNMGIGGVNGGPEEFFFIASFTKKLSRKQAINFLKGFAHTGTFLFPVEMNLSRAKALIKHRSSSMPIVEEWAGFFDERHCRILLLTDPQDDFSYLVGFISPKNTKIESVQGFQSIYTLLDRIH